MKKILPSLIFLVIIFTTTSVYATSDSETNTPQLTIGSLGSDQGHLHLPRGIAVDSTGNVYVADNRNHRVEKFDSSGTYVSAFDLSSIPEGVAVDNSDNIYVLDVNKSSVEKFSPDGTFLSSFGSPGSDPGQLGNAQRLAIDNSGNIYVTDVGMVQKFDSQGNYIMQFLPNDTENCCMNAMGISVDTTGNIYVADMFYHRIIKFSPTGNIASEYNATFSNSQLPAGTPQDVAVDSDGYIYVADTPGGKIVKLDPHGNPVSGLDISGVPVGIAIRGDMIYVTDIGNNRVDVFQKSQFVKDVGIDFAGTQKKEVPLNQNSTALDMAIKLATNSPEFQSLVEGYNYTFSSDFEESGPLPTGGIGLTAHGFAFDLYSGTVQQGKAVRIVEVLEDPSLTKILNVTSYLAVYHYGHETISSVPDNSVQQENDSSIPLPLQQFRSGIAANDVKCKQDLHLVIKSEDDSPACVKESTTQRLVSLNWGIILQTQNQQVMLEQTHSSANNNFAFAFFSKIQNQDKSNIFFSPYSISEAFSMAYEGAKGNTAKQLQSVFGFIPDDSTRKNNIKSQNEQLISTNKYQLNTANAWWVQNSYPILPSYTNTLENYYKAQITNLDLQNDSENSRKTINLWVENKTNQKIIDLLPPGSINYQTRAVLTNAVYFKANWTSQFSAQDTSDQNFTTSDGMHVKIPMMKHGATFPYYEDDAVQVLSMPYQGDRLSMVVILPKDDIQSLGTLTQDRFNNWNSKLSDVPVNVYMPKFTLDTKYTLNDILDTMGITDAFDPNTSDFSGITGNHDLFISTAIHQAYVKVDEKGTEAAAATGAVFQSTSVLLSQHTFRADHPFVFVIYDKQTDLVLFLGQVTNPTAS